MELSGTRDDQVGTEVGRFMAGLVRRNPGEPEFHQAVEEVVQSLMPFLLENPQYQEDQILERMTEPDRVIIFRVTWEDDQRPPSRQPGLAGSIQQRHRPL